MSEDFTRAELKNLVDTCGKEKLLFVGNLARYALALLDRREKADTELEQAEVQLAGCSTAAQGYGKDCKQGDYGWSVAFSDVQELYDKLTAARKVVEAVRELRTVGQGKIQWVEILDRIDDLIDDYDKAVGK